VSELEIVEGRGMRIERDPSSSSEVERQRIEAADGANGGPLHIHRRQEERFIVESGVLLVRRGRERIRLGAGQEVAIPPGTSHTWRAKGESRFRAEFRPALRTWEYFQEVLVLPTDRRGNPRIRAFARVTRAYPEESPSFPFVPTAVQKTLAVLLSKV
jgi:mannose-6-phosphate isomerase-like protein (cupin superfamily)